MNSILQATSELLKSRKFQPALTDEGDMLLVRCCGEELFWTTMVDTAKDGTIITLLSRVPVKVPVAKRGACAKLLARLNYGKRQGAFHLDLSDGEVLYCISSTLAAGIASEETLESLFGTTFSAMNESAPEVFKLVYGRGSVSDHEPATAAADPGRGVTPPGLNN